MAESEDEDSSLNLTGFLFGNINEKGELEDTEILDEVMQVVTKTVELPSVLTFGVVRVIMGAKICQQSQAELPTRHFFIRIQQSHAACNILLQAF